MVKCLDDRIGVALLCGVAEANEDFSCEGRKFGSEGGGFGYHMLLEFVHCFGPAHIAHLKWVTPHGGL